MGFLLVSNGYFPQKETLWKEILKFLSTYARTFVLFLQRKPSWKKWGSPMARFFPQKESWSREPWSFQLVTVFSSSQFMQRKPNSQKWVHSWSGEMGSFSWLVFFVIDLCNESQIPGKGSGLREISVGCHAGAPRPASFPPIQGKWREDDFSWTYDSW